MISLEMLVKTANEDSITREEILGYGFKEAQIQKMEVGARFFAQKIAMEMGLVKGTKMDPNLHGQSAAAKTQEAGGAVATDEVAKHPIKSIIEQALGENFTQKKLEGLGGVGLGEVVVPAKQMENTTTGKPAKEASWTDFADDILGIE